MADRYWVGGTNTWDATAGTKWSTTAGGAGGASVPTSADSVFFTSATTYTVTVSGTVNCLNMTVSAGTVTFSSTGTIQISGNLTTVAATILNHNAITFLGNATHTITTNNAQGQNCIWNFNGTGTYTLGSAARCQYLNMTNGGTFSTSASNYALTVTIEIAISNTGVSKTLSFNGSTITISNGTGILTNNETVAGNFTLNAGTSTVTFGTTSGFAKINSLNKALTFYNLTTTSTGYDGLVLDCPLGITFNNFTLSTSKTLLVSRLFTTGNITINGTFTVAGTPAGATPFNRYQIMSETIGTARTITAAAVSLIDVDFADITGAGAATWTGTRLGNMGGNTNITFPAAKTVYYSAVTAGNWGSANWATASAGAGAATNFPLAQDTAIIDNSSGTGTLTFNGNLDDGYAIPNLICSSRSTAITFSFTSNPIFIGNVTLSSAITMSGTGATGTYNYRWTVDNTAIFAGRGTQTINANGGSFNSIFWQIDKPAGSFVLGGAYNGNRLTLVSGTLNLSTFTMTLTESFVFPSVAGFTNLTKTLAFGTGNITLTGSGTVWNTLQSGNLTITGTPTVNINNNTATATTVTLSNTFDELIAINFNFTSGTYTLTLSQYTGSLNFTGFAGTLPNAARTIFGSFTASTGMTLTAGTGTMTFAQSSGTATINTAGKILDFPITFNSSGVDGTGTFTLAAAMTVGSTRTVTLTDGTLNLATFTLSCGLFDSSGTVNRTIAFGTGNITLTGSGTVWNTGTDTGLTTTGTPVVNVNNNTATATTVTPGFLSEANSISFNFTSGTYALTLATSGQTVNSLNFTGFAGTLDNQPRTIYGSFTASTGMTLTAGTNAQTFASTSGTKTITANGKTFDFPVTFNGAGGTWQLSDALTLGSTRTLTHTNGTLNLNGQTLNCGASYTTAAGTKNITFNGGNLQCTNSGATAFNNAAPTGFTTTAGTGTGKISMTSASAKTFVGGGSTYNCNLSNEGLGTLTITGNNTFLSINNTANGSTITLPHGGTTTVSGLSINGINGTLNTLNSSSAGIQATLSDASGTTEIDFIFVRDVSFTGGTTFNFGTNAFNVDNCSGINAPYAQNFAVFF